MKAAECHMQNRSLFHAAKCFEQVIICDNIKTLTHLLKNNIRLGNIDIKRTE